MNDSKRVYDGKFDLDLWMDPVWRGSLTVYESVMFVGKNDRVRLLYDARDIISVRSFDLKTEYVRGVDYEYADGRLYMPEGSGLSYIPED